MINLKNLSKTYPSPTKTRPDLIALSSLSVDIEKGKTVAVIGQNGSGKSTLLSILAGQIDEFEGDAEIASFQAPGFTRHFPVAYAAEQPAFNPTWTVTILFQFVSKLQGLKLHEYYKKVGEIVEYFQLGELLDKPFGSLSKGMRQRVNLAQSLITNSDLIVWDEPTSGLDWVFTDLVESKMRELKDAGKTVVFSSHDIHLTKNICDHMIYLKGGNLLYEGDFMGWNQYLCASADPLESRLLKQI